MKTYIPHDHLCASLKGDWKEEQNWREIPGDGRYRSVHFDGIVDSNSRNTFYFLLALHNIS